MIAVYEQPYMAGVFEWLAEPARSRGRAVVPAVGFDVVPGDLACALAASGLEPLASVDIAYSVSRFSATRGTLHSALEMLTGGDVEYAGGGWRPVGRAPLHETFDFPSPIGSEVVLRFPAAGALAPAQVVDPEEFLGVLGEHGVSHRVERPATREPTART